MPAIPAQDREEKRQTSTRFVNGHVLAPHLLDRLIITI
jgi:hypothetical protein